MEQKTIKTTIAMNEDFYNKVKVHMKQRGQKLTPLVVALLENQMEVSAQ